MFSIDYWSIYVLFYTPNINFTILVWEIKFSPILLKTLDISLRVK